MRFKQFLLDWVYPVILYLEGKKAIILALESATVVYLLALHAITNDLAVYIQTVFSIIFGGAAATSTTVGYKEFKATK